MDRLILCINSIAITVLVISYIGILLTLGGV